MLSPAQLDGAFVAHDEKNRADDPEGNFQPAVDHEREVEIGKGEQGKRSAADREEIEEEADEQAAQIADTVVI